MKTANTHYRGWDVEYRVKPIPCRWFDWTATPPGHDGEPGATVKAATFEELCELIDEEEADRE